MGGGDSEVKETPEQKAYAEVALKKWNDYQQVFKPAENNFMQKVNRMGSDKQFQQASNQGATSTNMAFQSAINADNANTFRGGINPNSGKFQARQSALHNAMENAKVDTTSRTLSTQNERFVGGLKAISAIGAGKEADAIAGMSDIASNSAAYARNSALNKAQNSQLMGEVAGSAVGAGLAHYTNPNKTTTQSGVIGSNASDYSDDIMNTWNGG